MDVEPHAPDVVAEDVVVVAFAAWLDHAQVGHWQVAWLITVHLVKVLSCLSIIQKGTFFPREHAYFIRENQCSTSVARVIATKSSSSGTLQLCLI